MNARFTVPVVALAAILLPRVLLADAPAPAAPREATPAVEDDPRDAAIFGDEQGGQDDEAGGDRDAAIFGDADDAASDTAAADDLGDPRMRGEVVERRDLLDDDRLQLGGLFYMQNGLFLAEDTAWHRQAFTQINLTDIYFDARPNDRVRAFIRGRMLYTPVSGDATSSALLGLTGAGEDVRMVLDQLWLKFDVQRLVYLTIGAQHVRWGATRLWNPVDVIYATRRNPLTLFDQRTGVPMLKVHVPLEVGGNTWNVYALALADDASDLAHFGVAGRVEAVVSTWEVGLTAMRRRKADPRLGLDLSAGIWELDVTGELGVRLGDGGASWMASGGLSYTLSYGDDDALILGVEYFHNPDGYPTAARAARGIADISLSQLLYGPRSEYAGENAFDFFYMGRHYAAIFAVAMGPGSWDDTRLTLSALSNLSDRTGLVRLDVGTSVLTDLRVEVYASAFLGGDGELRFYSDSLPAAMEAALPAALATLRPDDLTDEAKKLMGDPAAASALAAGRAIPTPMAQVGVNLRLAL